MQSFTRGFKFLLIVSVAVVLLHQLAQVGAVVIEDCGGKEAVAKLSFVDVENCGEKDAYCPFIRGKNATTEVGFKTIAGFKEAKIDVLGKFGKFSKHFPITPDNACGNYGFNCPVAPDQDITLKITLPVKSYYPKNFLVQVVFRLLDENKKDIFCVSFPAKIVEQ